MKLSKLAVDLIPEMTMLGIGILIGAGLGLMFARTSGRELRSGVRARLSRKAHNDNGTPDAPGGRTVHEPAADAF